MDKVFDGSLALVTGGSCGIGAAVALRLAEDGADVALPYRGNVGRAAGLPVLGLRRRE